MRHWEKALIGPEATYRDALISIDATGAGIALIADADRRLLGVLSDGDLRRALIRGAGLEDAALSGANREPFCIDQHQDKTATLTMLRVHGLRQLPVLDADRRVIGLTTISDFLNIPTRTNPVVIMAGGKGSRLAELTRDTPKPMLKVGPRPMLDTVIDAFAAQGFRRIYLSINYRGEQIESHFGDGASRGLEIRYLRETQPLGTCGSLALLPPDVDAPVLVANGDVLTKLDFGQLLDGHEASGAAATVVVRDYEMQVPFGVVRSDEGRVLAIEEKPSFVHRINAGVYALSRAALDAIPRERAFDMPQLLDTLIQGGRGVRAHRAEGYWVDVGRMADLARANADYGAVFEGG